MSLLKRIISIVLIITYILISFSYADTGTVNVSASRIREESSTNSEILTVVYEDDKLEILGEIGEWYKVKTGEHTGFIKKEFVDVTKTPANNTRSNTNTNTNTNSSNRNTANTNSNTDNKTNSNSNTNTVDNTNTVVENTPQDVDTEGNTSRYKTKDIIDLKLVDTDITVREDINLKLVPSFLSRETNSVAKGTSLKVTAEMNLWIQVSDGSSTGWILKTKIVNLSGLLKSDSGNTGSDTTPPETPAVDTQNPETPAAPKEKIGKINVEVANIRESANPNAKIIGSAERDNKVTILEEESDWYKVKTEEIEQGYISKVLVTVE